MTNQEKAVQLIERQQTKLQAESNAWYVGEQLKEMVAGDSWAAGVLVEELEKNPQKSVDAAESQIAEYAKQHKKGNTGCCPPQKAEEILRKFYGIEKEHAPDTTKGRGAAIRLEDFF